MSDGYTNREREMWIDGCVDECLDEWNIDKGYRDERIHGQVDGWVCEGVV